MYLLSKLGVRALRDVVVVDEEVVGGGKAGKGVLVACLLGG